MRVFLWAWNFSVKKNNKQAYNCLDSLNYLYYYPQPPIKNLCVHTYFYLWPSMNIFLWKSFWIFESFFTRTLFKSFLSVRISSFDENLFESFNPFFMRTLFESFYPWESLLFMKISSIYFICENFFFFNENLFISFFKVFIKISKRMNPITWKTNNDIDCIFLSCHVRVSEWIHTL